MRCWRPFFMASLRPQFQNVDTDLPTLTAFISAPFHSPADTEDLWPIFFQRYSFSKTLDSVLFWFAILTLHTSCFFTATEPALIISTCNRGYTWPFSPRATRASFLLPLTSLSYQKHFQCSNSCFSFLSFNFTSSFCLEYSFHHPLSLLKTSHNLQATLLTSPPLPLPFRIWPFP